MARPLRIEFNRRKHGDTQDLVMIPDKDSHNS